MNNYTVRKDRRGKWRWQVKSSNGRIMGASSQGFSSKDACHRNAHRVRNALFHLGKE